MKYILKQVVGGGEGRLCPMTCQAVQWVHNAMGKRLPQQQAGLCHAHLAKQFLTNKVSGANIQQVAMFAKGCGVVVFKFLDEIQNYLLF